MVLVQPCFLKFSIIRYNLRKKFHTNHSITIITQSSDLDSWKMIKETNDVFMRTTFFKFLLQNNCIQFISWNSWKPLFSFRFSDVNNAKHNVFLDFNDFAFSCMTSTKSYNDQCDNITKGSDICFAYLNRIMFALFNVINFADVEDLK